MIHQASIAALVTTSSFTRQAREMAAHAGILLFDADGLGGWASGTGPAPWGTVALAAPVMLPGQQANGKHARRELTTEQAAVPDAILDNAG